MATRLRRLEQNSLAKRAYDELKAAILGGKLAPGSSLAEVELATALGISRTPVREALGRLRTNGLVEALPSGGNVVRSLSASEVRELFLVRDALEQLGVTEWVDHPEGQDLAELEELIEEQKRAERAHNLDRFLDADERFHFTISRQAALPQTADLLLSLRERMRQAGLAAIAQPDRLATVIKEHTAIFRALKSGDAAAARKALQQHLSVTRSALEARRADAGTDSAPRARRRS